MEDRDYNGKSWKTTRDGASRQQRLSSSMTSSSSAAQRVTTLTLDDASALTSSSTPSNMQTSGVSRNSPVRSTASPTSHTSQVASGKKRLLPQKRSKLTSALLGKRGKGKQTTSSPMQSSSSSSPATSTPTTTIASSKVVSSSSATSRSNFVDRDPTLDDDRNYGQQQQQRDIVRQGASSMSARNPPGMSREHPYHQSTSSSYARHQPSQGVSKSSSVKSSSSSSALSPTRLLPIPTLTQPKAGRESANDVRGRSSSASSQSLQDASVQGGVDLRARATGGNVAKGSKVSKAGKGGRDAAVSPSSAALPPKARASKGQTTSSSSSSSSLSSTLKKGKKKTNGDNSNKARAKGKPAGDSEMFEEVGELPRMASSSRQLHRKFSMANLSLSSSVNFGSSRADSAPRVAFGTVDTYKRLEELGKGTYAVVYKGISHVNGKIVALKEITFEHQEGAPCTAIREVALLKRLKHSNVVTLHDIVHTASSLTMVFEFVPRDLQTYMDLCNGYIALPNVKLFLFQLLRAIAYCHSKKIFHRDLKPQNILIHPTGELKLADFGLARSKNFPIKTFSHEVVTLWYRPPDVLLGSVEYSGDIDIWGVGCIFVEMVCGNPLFPGESEDTQVDLIFALLGSPSEASWPEASSLPNFYEEVHGGHVPQKLAPVVPRLSRVGISLLESMVQLNPKHRSTADDALHHPYFKQLGRGVHKLSPTQSIFRASALPYKPEPEVQMQYASSTRRRIDRKRRGSVRF